MNNPTPKIQQLSTAEVRLMAINDPDQLHQEAAISELRRRRSSGEANHYTSPTTTNPMNAACHTLVL